MVPALFLCVCVHMRADAAYFASLTGAKIGTMSIEVPTKEPTVIVSGDFVTWKRQLSDYPATLYTLAYRLVGSAGVKTITATADGTDHLIEIEGASQTGPPAVVGTDVYGAGWYEWTASVTEIATSRRKTLETGSLEVKPNPLTAKASDMRSHARKVLAAIEAVIEGTASHEQSEMSIDGKSLKRRSIEDLLKLRTIYKAEVKAETAAQSGAKTGGRIVMKL